VPDREFTVLRTPRLLLRRFQPGDLEPFVAYRADPGVARYQGWEAGYSRAQGEAFIQWLAAADPDTPGEWYQFAIERRQAPGLIGDCAARFDDDAVEVGFTLAPEFQGQGYATEAVERLLGYIASRGHRQAVAWCDVENVASRRVLDRLEFTLRETIDGEYRYTRELAL